jgi:hypothetical protein
MKGTIISHKPKQGKKTFGYSLFLGRDENGKQLRQVKRGFQRECDAEAACLPATPPAGARSGSRHRIGSRAREVILRDSGPVGAGKTI